MKLNHLLMSLGMAVLLVPGAWARGSATATADKGASERQQAQAAQQAAEATLQQLKESRQQAPPLEQASAVTRKSVQDGEVWQVSTTPYNAPRLQGAKTATPEQVAGWYLEFDTVITKNGYSLQRYNARLETSSSSKGNVQITQFSGVPFTDCYATLSGSTLTIPAGNYCPVSNSAGATTLALCCPLDPNQMVFYPDKPIVGTVQENGNIVFPSWGIFVVDSTGQGASVVQANINTRLERANAIMSGTDYKSNELRQWPVRINQTNSNRLEVENFGNTGRPAFVDLFYNGRIEVAPQYMGTTQYGEVDNMVLSDNGYGISDSIMTVQATESNIINLPNWGVCLVSNPSQYVLKLKDAKLTLLENSFTLPQRFPTNFSGSGTEGAPYQIKNYQDLMALSQMVREGQDTKGAYYRLESDIDCANQQYYFTPIGSIFRDNDYINTKDQPTGTPFTGHFDGGNHTIKGIDFNSGRRAGSGIFAWVAPGATVKNLRVDNSTFLTDGIGTGAIAGLNNGEIINCQSTNNQILFTSYDGGGIAGGNNGLIEKCYSSSTVVGYGNMGGIVGSDGGILRDCQARGSMTFMGVESTLFDNAGGLVGSINSSFSKEGYPAVIERCIATMIITDRNSDATCGGFVGATLGGSSTTPVKITECLSMSTVSSQATSVQTGPTSYTNGRVGGFVGNFWHADISDCFVSGVVLATKDPKHCGALIGYVMSDKSNKISNLLSNAQIIVGNTTPDARLAIYSQMGSTEASYLSNVYYDKQIAGLDYTGNNFTGAKTTAELTTANAPEGFSADKWQFTAGLYPMLKSLADEGSMQIASAPIFLQNGETMRMVKTDFPLSQLNNVKWGLMNENGLSTTGTGLDIVNGTAKIKNDFAQEILCAYNEALPYIKEIIVNIVPSKMWGGSGTEADPYQIKTINDLKNLQLATTTQSLTYEGVYFKVMNDIDCKGDIGFEGIASDGNTKHEFSGIFDGGGHTIDGVVLEKVNYDANGKAQSSGSMQYCGFIGRLNAKGVVKNLTLGANCRMTFWGNSGAISGYVGGRIENCANLGTVLSISTTAGGIGGQVQKTGVISNCRFDGTVISGGNNFAGIAGYNQGLVENCLNNGTIVGDSINPYHKRGNDNYAGGIVGNLPGGKIMYCVNQGNVTSHKLAGGIYGYNSSAVTVQGNVNTGIVTAGKGFGLGAIGGDKPASTATIADNYYDGQVMTQGAINRSSFPGCTALTTAELCSKTLPQGLPDSLYDFAAGMYPVLKSHKDATATAALRHIWLELPAGNTIADVTANGTLGTYQGLNWTMEQGSATIYSISGNKLNVAQVTDREVKHGSVTGTVNGMHRTFSLTTVPDMFEGHGTVEAPYLIRNKADWALLANLTNNEGLSYSGKQFRLMADLDYANDTVFAQVGGAGGTFGGVFNGDNHSILNLKVRHIPGMALFGTLTETGAVRNLTLKGGEFAAPSGNVVGFVLTCRGIVENCVNYNTMNAKVGASYASGFVYELQTGGKILNCTNHGTIIARSGTSGGIVSTAQTGTEISDCSNYGAIEIMNNQIGGIAGKSSGIIRNCLNTADLNGSRNQVGGIVGWTSDTVRIINCVNRGNLLVTGSGSSVAGILGYASGKGYITRCHNYGTVESQSTSTYAYIGGIVGQSSKTLHMSATVNHANIKGLNGQYVGGIAGYLNSSGDMSYVDSVYNYGDVEGGNKYIGGFSGYERNDVMHTDCGNYGNVTGTAHKASSDNTAGFTGYSYGDFTRCFNSGEVTAKGVLVSGFLSEGSGDRIFDCFNVGNVTSTATSGASLTKPSAVGFWATGRCDTLANTYNMGTVSGYNYVSGFIGNFNTKNVVLNCYVAGEVTATEANGTATPFLLSSPSSSTFTGNCYDMQVVSARGGNLSTSIVKGMGTAEMLNYALCDAYQAIPACYPTLKSMSGCIPGNFAAATIAFKTPEENASNVLHSLTIGLPEGISWTCSPEFRIEGNRVILLKKDEKGVRGWVEKKGGELVRRYDLTINDNTGVEGIEDEANVVSRTYYTPEGLQILNPEPGMIVIEKVLYKNGRCKVTRRIHKGNK